MVAELKRSKPDHGTSPNVDLPTAWVSRNRLTLLWATQIEPEEFLIGREAVWSDITEGYAVERTFEAELGTHASHPTYRAVLISGTAG